VLLCVSSTESQTTVPQHKPLAFAPYPAPRNGAGGTIASHFRPSLCERGIAGQGGEPVEPQWASVMGELLYLSNGYHPSIPSCARLD
jgi:hypothetical protein